MTSLHCFLAILPIFISTQGARSLEVASEKVPLRPVPFGEKRVIAEMPDLGELAGPEARKQHIVDHGFIEGKDGKWTLWACLRGTKPGRILYGWQGDSLLQGPWQGVGVVARAEAAFGEKTQPAETIQAPHFVRDGDHFLCFYNSNGIRLMVSDDGHQYKRGHPAKDDPLLYADGGRDVMAMRYKDRWYAYSTVSTTDGRGYIILRTSDDLIDWTPAKIVNEGGRAGGGPISAESPFVVPLGGFFYLFRASSTDGRTYVYRSESPDDFGVNDDSKLITDFAIKAPEVLHHDGKWWISDLGNFQKLTLQELKWETDVR